MMIIIFLTSLVQYALEGYDVNAANYLINLSVKTYRDGVRSLDRSIVTERGTLYLFHMIMKL